MFHYWVSNEHAFFELKAKALKSIHCYRKFAFTLKLAFPCFPESSGISRQIIRNVIMLCCMFVSNSKLVFAHLLVLLIGAYLDLP